MTEYIRLRDAIPILPGRPAISTVRRWYLRGVRGVKLQTVLVGGRRYTTRDAIERFITALSQQNRETGGP